MRKKGKMRYHYATWTIARTVYELKRKTVNVDPEYQRSIVWSDEKQMNLINTLIDELPIPTFYLATMKADERYKYECVDGKNRLQALWLFCENKLQVDGMFFEEMDEEMKERFLHTEIQVCILNEMSFNFRTEYFRRIQEGVSLSKCEIIWSMHNHELVSFLKNIRTIHFEILQKTWNTRRFADLVYLLNTVSMMTTKEVLSANAGHGEHLINFVKKFNKNQNIDFQELNDKFSLLFIKIEEITYLLQLMTGIKKSCLILDLTRYIIYNKYRLPDIEKLTMLIETLAFNNESCDMYTMAYKHTIDTSLGSKQYTLRSIGARMKHLINYFN